MMHSLFFHVDIDAFYATVEVLDNPQYQGKALVVGGMGRRGVVSTSSYEARAKGVHSAMPMYEAKRIAPDAIFLPCRMERYKEKSKEVMQALSEYTPCFQQISIDEAFLEFTGMSLVIEQPEAEARKIKTEIKEKTGITVSIGGGANKYIAKMASSFAKPDGLLIIEEGKEAEFMKSVPLKKVWGVGKQTLKRLENAKINTVQDVLSFSEGQLKVMFGSACGSFLYYAVRGVPNDVFAQREQAKSISAENTFEVDESDATVIDDMLFELADEIAGRLIKQNLSARTVTLKMVYYDFSKKTVSSSDGTIFSVSSLYKKAKSLFEKTFEGKKLRLLGIATTNLFCENEEQDELFSFPQKEKQRKVENLIRSMQKQNIPITSARLLKRHEE